MDVRSVKLSDIIVGEHDVRAAEEDPELADLAASIDRDGLLQPLGVREDEEGLHLIYGHRRYAACRMAGVTDVMVIVRDGDGAAASRWSFSENLFRKDLSAVELASAIDGAISGGTMTVQQVALGLHRSERWVLDQRALLTWPPDVLEVVHHRRLAVSAAASLAEVTDEDYRRFLVAAAVENGATARTTAAWLQAWRALLPPEAAVDVEPGPVVPSSPSGPVQAPCAVCSELYAPDGLVRVVICPGCVETIRELSRRLR